MPVRLWRYIAADLWRRLLITAVVLVTVIAFAVTIPPLADGKLTPLDAIKFMALATVPMLAYAVPFAAGFASTLVYHRLAQDNEAAAAHAGGIGHRSLLAPALASGVALALLLGIISDQAVPRFLRSMERYVRLDIAEWMIVQLGLGNAFEFGGTLLAAEAVRTLEPRDVQGATDAQSVVALTRPAILFLNADDSVRTAATAEIAWLVVRPTPSPWEGPDAGAGSGADGDPRFGSIVTLIAENYRAAGDDSIIRSESRFRYDIAIPPVIGDDPKFFSFAQLAELRRHPERFDFIDEFRHRLALRTAAVEFLESVNQQLRARGSAALTTDTGATVTIHAPALGPGPSLTRRVIAEPGGAPLRIEVSPADGSPTETLAAHDAVLNTFYQDELTVRRVECRLELQHVASSGRTSAEDLRRAAESDQPVAGVRRQRTIATIIDPSPRYAELRTMPLASILEVTRPYTLPPAPFEGAVEAHARLGSMERRLQHEITANEHERVAMSFAGMVMVLTGSVVAIKLKNALPLTVYLWAFFPALASVLVISMGKQLTHEFGPVGLLPLWLGVLAPLAYAVVTYRQIARR